MRRPYSYDYDEAYDVTLKCAAKCGSQAELADVLGVSESTVSRWLQRGRLPRMEYMFMMYKLLGVERVPKKLLAAKVVDVEAVEKADGRKTAVFRMGMDMLSVAVIRCGGVAGLARATGVSKSSIYQWLGGKRAPTWTEMCVVLDFMGATLACPLLDDDDDGADAARNDAENGEGAGDEKFGMGVGSEGVEKGEVFPGGMVW